LPPSGIADREGWRSCLRDSSASRRELNLKKRRWRELADALQQITGAEFKVTTDAKEVPERAIIVGPGSITSKYFCRIESHQIPGGRVGDARERGQAAFGGWASARNALCSKPIFARTMRRALVTPWATNMPLHRTLQVPDLDVREEDCLRIRAPFWFAGFEPAWKAHNCVKRFVSEIPRDFGGCIKYKGHAHNVLSACATGEIFRGTSGVVQHESKASALRIMPSFA